MTNNPETWQFYKSVIDGHELKIDGLNIWDHDWQDQHRSIAVKDPIYQEDHTMGVYEINAGTKTIRFAAGEFSNMVWRIYLPVI